MNNKIGQTVVLATQSYLYYYNVAVLNLNLPLSSFPATISKSIVAIDLQSKTIIYHSSGIVEHNPTVVLLWIRLSLCRANLSASTVQVYSRS
jgi:hypothetical protein